MPALTASQLSVDKWSKFTLLGSTLLFVYSLAVLLIALDADRRYHHDHHEEQHHGGPSFHAGGHHHNHHHDRHHNHDHQDGPCRLHHFASLGLLTAITGIIASFKNRRGWAVAFLILVLITEISALGYIGYKNAQAVHMCTAVASTETLKFKAEPVQLPNGQTAEKLSLVGAKLNVNQPLLEDCMGGVRHAAIIGSLIVGVIACSLACCGSRFSSSLSEREAEEALEDFNNSCVVNNNNNNTKEQPVTCAIVVTEQVGKEQPQQF